MKSFLAVLKALPGIVILSGLLGFAGWYVLYQAPLAIAADYAIKRENTYPALHATLEKARCKAFYLLLSHCEVTVTIGDETREMGYLLFGRYGGDGVGLLADATDPAVLTTDFGLDHLPRRMATWAAAVGLYVAMIVSTFRWILRLRVERRIRRMQSFADRLAAMTPEQRAALPVRLVQD